MIHYFPYLHVVISLLKGQSKYMEYWWKLVLQCTHKAEEAGCFTFQFVKARYPLAFSFINISQFFQASVNNVRHRGRNLSCNDIVQCRITVTHD